MRFSIQEVPSLTNKSSADFTISSRAEKPVGGQHFNSPQYYSCLVLFFSFFSYRLLPRINSYWLWQIKLLTRPSFKTWHKKTQFWLGTEWPHQILFFVGSRGRRAETYTGDQRQAGMRQQKAVSYSPWARCQRKHHNHLKVNMWINERG